MPPLERQPIPDWAARERARDLSWIQENLHVFWPAAQSNFAEAGRGAIVVDTTSRPTGEGHPFVYLPNAGIEEMKDADALRMIGEYDPSWEFVTLLFKSQDRVSTYRVGVPSAKQEDREEKLPESRQDDQLSAEGTDDIPITGDTELLRKADRGLLPCPNCGKPLKGTMLVSSVYEGVMLYCEDKDGCGFYEL